ncbi:IS3 family transposase [Candidatus Nomurabacteria bacterium]|nr:IS3 family transposase [Candidatus Nomurabacteria bacterium]
MIDPENTEIPIVKQCELANLNRSTYYFKPKRPGKYKKEQKLLDKIEELWFEHPSSGYRTIRERLKDYGFYVNSKKVLRLMKQLGIYGMAPGPMTSKAHPEHKKYPYILKDLEISRPNQVWCSDITYLKTGSGKMYLVAIIDAYSRMIMSWALSNTLDASFCVDALKNAIQKHGKPEIFNTDQGCQFTSEGFIGVLTANGITISMDGKGRAFDNILIERFWRSLKYEDFYLRDYSASTLKSGIDSYILYYNWERPHQAFSGLKPSEIYYKGKVNAFLEQYKMNQKRHAPAPLFRLSDEQKRPFSSRGRLRVREEEPEQERKNT